jgi:formate hydrogenlyase subunit 3/multisubunit Na+/H+ antiporter MnhD subunit
MLLPIIALTTLTVLLGVLPGTLLDLASGAAMQLLDRRQYLDAVLGTAR